MLSTSLKNVLLVVLALTAVFFVIYFAMPETFAPGVLVATLVAALVLALAFWFLYRYLRPAKRS